jgi:hypothetical protein
MIINLPAVLVATVVEFIVGAIWYTPLFGKLWGKIHGFDKLPKEDQASMQKKMMPLLAVQLLLTFVTTCVLSLFVGVLPIDWNTFGIAGFFWLGFVAPAQIASVIFGGTDPKWLVTKSAIMVGGSFVTLMAAALVLHIMR